MKISNQLRHAVVAALVLVGVIACKDDPAATVTAHEDVRTAPAVPVRPEVPAQPQPEHQPPVKSPAD